MSLKESEKDIDRDIELLKEYLKSMLDIPVGENVCILWAIENLIKELESYRGKVILSDEEYNKVIENAQKDIKSELEKYKKIAERIAKVTCRTANYDDSVLEQKVKETIDWARKEVEKDDKIC